MKIKRIIIVVLVIGVVCVKGLNIFMESNTNVFSKNVESFKESLDGNDELLKKIENAQLFIGEVSDKVGVSLGEVTVSNVLEAKVYSKATKRTSHILYDTEYNCYFSIDMEKLNYSIQNDGIVLIEYDLINNVSVVSKKIKSEKLKDECEVMLTGSFFERLRHTRDLDISEAKGLFDAHREYICNKVVRLEDIQKNMENSLISSISVLAEAMDIEVEFKNITNNESTFEYSDEIQDRDLNLIN